MKINPTLDRVVIKKCEFESVYKTNIILVDSSKNDINKLVYTVEEVGPGMVRDGKEITMVVKPGDKIIVPEYIGSEIQIDGIEYRIINQSDILAIVE